VQVSVATPKRHGLAPGSASRRLLPRFSAPSAGTSRITVADSRRPRDRRCALLGWLLIIIIVVPILAVIGLFSIIRGIGRKVRFRGIQAGSRARFHAPRPPDRRDADLLKA
jgi:hypothetical protein